MQEIQASRYACHKSLPDIINTTLILIYITGQSECKWGRIEWCANPANAKRCHKTNYCMRFRWFKPQPKPGTLTTTSSSSSSSRLPTVSISKRCLYPASQWCSSYKIAKACNVSIIIRFPPDSPIFHRIPHRSLLKPRNFFLKNKLFFRQEHTVCQTTSLAQANQHSYCRRQVWFFQNFSYYFLCLSQINNVNFL